MKYRKKLEVVAGERLMPHGPAILRRARPVLPGPGHRRAAAVTPARRSPRPGDPRLRRGRPGQNQLAAARRHLDEQCDQHLITEPAAGRYVLHDQPSKPARTLAERGPRASRDAVRRLLACYLRTAPTAASSSPRPGPVNTVSDDGNPTARNDNDLWTRLSPPRSLRLGRERSPVAAAIRLDPGSARRVEGGCSAPPSTCE